MWTSIVGFALLGVAGYVAPQSKATVMGIRVLMLVIPIILAFASLGIYKNTTL